MLNLNKLCTYCSFKRESEVVLLDGGLVMELSADLGQSRRSRVLYIETSHLMSNLLLHVNVDCYLHGNMSLSRGSNAYVHSDHVTGAY